MKNLFWIVFFTVIISAFSFLYAHNKGYCEDVTVQSALDAARNVRSQVDSKEKLNSRLNVPATSDTVQMETFGTHEKFDATIMCPGAGPIISVQMLPEDSLAGSGEVRLKGFYDLNQDGNLVETDSDARHVGGICGDGYIANCSPHGSWNDCKFYKWFFHEGKILALDYDPEFSDNENQRPISLADLHGCFCFNRSCNNAIRGRKSQVLSYFASGIMDVIRRVNNEVVITKVDENPAMLTLDYIGASVSDCHTNISDDHTNSSVQELTNLSGSLDFNEESAVSSAPADSVFGVLSSAHSNTAGGESYSTYQCEIESKVEHRLEVKTRDPKISCEKVPTDPEEPVFDIVNPDTTDGHWYHPDGKNGYVLAHNEMMRVSINPSYCEPLNFMWTTVEVKCGDTWVTIRQVDGYYLNVSNSCSGGSFDPIDVTPRQYLNLVMNHFPDIEWWPKYKYECDGADDEKCLSANDLCRCVITDDIFTCYSSGMGPGDGSMIINNDSGRGYNKILFQGCEEIKDPENECKIYEDDPDCTLVSEITDGIPTMSGGLLTNAESMGSCRLIEGDARSITVCEPWWKKVRQYRCLSSLNFNYENVKARTKYVGQHIDYNNGDWSNQGDLRFSSDGSSFTEVFDPDLQFDTYIDVEELSCLVSYETENTDLMIDGLETTSFNSTRTIYESRVCEETNGNYICPHGEGETVESPCSDFDEKSFATAIAGLTTLRNAPSDMICSSGEKQGMCDPEDLGEETKRVVCYTNPRYDTDTDSYSGVIKDCVPNTWWRTSPLQNQTHRIYATKDYHCRAEYPGLSEREGEEDTDYFNNDLGALTPSSAWFNPSVNWAKPLIMNHLRNDPEFIPDPGPGCPCGGGSSSTSIGDGSGGTISCNWTVQTSVNNINRLDKLNLNAGSQTPFGNVELFFSRIGKWGGSHSGICTETGTNCQSVYACSSTGKYYDTLNACNTNCRTAGQCNVVYEWEYFGVCGYGYGTCPPGSEFVKQVGYGYNCKGDSSWGEWHSAYGGCQRIYSAGKTRPVHTRNLYHNGVLVASTSCSEGHSSESCPDDYYPFNSGCRVCRRQTAGTGCTINMKRDIGVCAQNHSPSCPSGYSRIAILGGDHPRTGYNGSGYYDGSYGIWSTKGICNMENYSGRVRPVYRRQLSQRTPAGKKIVVTSVISATDSASNGCYEYDYHGPSNPINTSCAVCRKVDVTNNEYATWEQCIAHCNSSGSCSRKYHCPSGNLANSLYTNLSTCNNNCHSVNCSLYGDDQNYSNLSTCISECTEAISCNAQSDNYRFKVGIKNPGTNIYTQELDLIQPRSLHIASASYTHEDLILSQCVDRYFKKFINFDDTPTGLHFEYKLADFLIYAAASIGRRELPVGSKGESYPGKLPQVPPVYTATYGEDTD
jgi:hypothetical protein